MRFLSPQHLTILAMAGSLLMMSHQVAGKAVRDAFFIGAYSINDLPKGVMAAATTAILLTLAFSRLLGWFGPRRVVPAAFLLSSAMHLAEWSLADSAPKLVGMAVYLHIMGFGATLLSGFWSVANETFDPSTAKRVFGRITGAGTVGSVLGPLLVVSLPTQNVLLLLASYHALCGTALLFMPAPSGSFARSVSQDSPSPATVFRQAPYLINVAVLILLSATSAAMIDFIFKRGAALEFGKGEGFVRFMALYQLSTQVISLLMQAFVTRVSLEKLGIARNIASLPIGVGAVASAGLMFPAFPMIVATRAIENVLHGSLFRSAYELLYTPVAPAEKRVAKTIIDVGCDRAGDALGGAIATVLISLTATYVRNELLGLAVGCALISAFIARRLDKVYTSVIEKRLIEHRLDLDISEVQDSTTMSAVLQTIATHHLSPELVRMPPAPVEPLQAIAGDDPVLGALQALRSGDAHRVSAILSSRVDFEMVEFAQIIRLLAWEEVAGQAGAVLVQHKDKIGGMMVDHLVDQSQDFAVRRRLPRIIARINSQYAFDGLLRGLDDSRFEVRFNCARALDYMFRKNPELRPPQSLILNAVERELSYAPAALASRRLLDAPDSDTDLAFLDEEVRERADKNLELVFSLLATILPREPLKVAFRAFHSGDLYLKGLALEYLEAALPSHALTNFKRMTAGDLQPAPRGRSREEIFNEIVQQREAKEFKPLFGDVRSSIATPPKATPE